MQPVQAASPTAPDREMLAQQATQNGGLMSVMVTIDDYSLNTISSRGSASIRAEVEKTVAALRSQLGSEALDAGYWNNGMGQIGLLVTTNGLRLLEQSNLVKAIQPDATRSMRDRAWMVDGEQKSIEAALTAKGLADIEIVLNSEIDYQIGERGETIYRLSETAARDQAQALDALQKASFGKSLQILDDGLVRSGTSAVLRARIDRAGYHALRMAPEVRALRLQGSARTSLWPADALESAAKNGEAEVTITLHGGDTYSPNEGYMSATAWKIQSQANQEVFNQILTDIGAGKDAQTYPGLGSFTVKLKNNNIQTLYARKDSRIRAVELNRPVALPMLANSMPLINMPPAWVAGFRGAGQRVIILDTGVKKDHLFFRNAAGTSRITVEACFGTNDTTYKSICPSQNSLGDSPVGLVNSGLPYSDAAYCTAQSENCSHGTHVAGIAAGRSNSALTPTGIQGVAPDASIIPIQVFSFPIAGTSTPSANNSDILAALNAVHAESVPGIQNPFTVNMSLGSSISFTGTCDSYYTAISTAIANLHSRGVPVVVATGNASQTASISFPSCLSKTIKVSAVKNDGIGLQRSSYANIANPIFYDGPMLLAPGGEASGQIHSASATSTSATRPLYGTSMATPHVTGYYAAVKGSDATASVADVTAWVTSLSGSISAPQTLPSGTYVFRRIRTSF